MWLEVAVYTFPVVFLLLFFYLAYRLGGVQRSGVPLTREQVRALKESRRRYRATHPPSRPEGRPLYKRKMVSHEGVAVYANGMRAKFVVGFAGRYRFVPFHEISDIYPMRIEFLPGLGLARPTATAEINGIQVETESSMVFVIESRFHDFDRLLPALKQAMGAWWGSKYHDDEVIRGTHRGGSVYVHRTVRREAPARAVEGAVPGPAISGRGRLLLEEGPEDLRARSRFYVKGGAVFHLAGVLFVLVGVFAYLYLAGSPPYFMFMMLALLTGPVFVVMGVLFLLMNRRTRPVRVYENGVEGYTILGARPFFIPYGEMTAIDERRVEMYGEAYLFKTDSPPRIVFLRKETPGLERLIDTLREKVGRPEYRVADDATGVKRPASKRAEYLMYAALVVASVVIGAMMTFVILPGESLPVFMAGFGWTTPIMTMLAVVFGVYIMKNDRTGLYPKELNLKIPAVIVVAMLVFALMSHAVSSNAFGPSPTVRHISPKPMSSEVAPGVHENATIVAYNDILVDRGQTLEFRNSTVRFHLATDGGAGIWVDEGGTLVLENTTVSSSYSDRGYTFEVMGRAAIRASTITGLWGEWDDYDGGLEIYSDNVTIEDSMFVGARESTIIVVGASPLIANSSILGAGDDGIELQGSNARVVNNTISTCEYGMYVYGGSVPLIEGNLISRNHFGILIEDSSPLILDNVFSYNDHEAVLYDSGSSPTLSGNRYRSNGANVAVESDLDTSALCMAATVVTAAFSLLYLFYLHRKGFKREEVRGRGTPPPW